MLRRIAIPLMLLQLLPAGARAGDVERKGRLDLVQETVWVRSPEALRKACGRTGIRACTELSAELTPGPCEATESGWRLQEPAVRLVARRILVGPSREPFDDLTVQHEANHIADFRNRLVADLDTLAKRAFESERACVAARERAKERFNARMKEIEAASNRRLHARRAGEMSAENRKPREAAEP